MGPSQQAIVKLEQSQEPIEGQLASACHILRLDPSSLVTAESCQDEISRTQQTTSFLGREQWILRWLLGRFQAKGSVGASVRSEPKAWRLLELLMHRIPLTIVARHLNTHKYLEVFYETLQEALELEISLDGDINHYGSSSAVSLVGSGAENTYEVSESSNTLMGSPAMSPSRPSRKRKRSEMSISGNQRRDLLERMTAVFRVLQELLALTKGKSLWQHSEYDDYESEYVKSVLRCEPTTAAKILGLSFELIYTMLKAYEKSPAHARHNADISVIINLTELALDFWNFRFGMIDEVEGNASNKLFASHCLVPELLLIENFGSISAPSFNPSRIVTLLEHKVALHILLPARSSFLRAGTSVEYSGTMLTSHRDPQIFTRSLDALRSSICTSAVQQPSSISQSVRTKTLLNSLPRLFVHATRCCRWKGSRGWNDDLPWLEAVFKELAEVAGIRTAPKAGPGLSSYQLSVLECLLQVAIDNSISLSTTLLRIIAISYCKLFTGDNSRDRWVLTEQIFKLDANVFLIPSHDENIPKPVRSLQNPLLETLFGKIAALARQSGGEASEMQQRIHQQIFLPLMQELASARALSSFIRFWHLNLLDLEERRLGGLDPALDLEDITILEVQSNSESLKNIFEKALSIKQIAGELDWLKSSIEPFSKSSPVQGKAQAFSALVILEAVLMSISREENISSLREQGMSLMDIILQQVRASIWPKRHRWRLWRLLTQIHTLWPRHHYDEKQEGCSFNRVSNVQYALERACKSIEKGGIYKTRSRVKTSVYREAYEAFGWILSFADIDKDRHSDVENTFSEVKQVLVTLSRFLNAGLENPANGSEQAAKQELDMPWRPRWDGRPEGLESPGTLAVALAARLILQYPFTFSLCSSTQRRDLFQSLYLSSISLGHAFKAHETLSDISFVEIWECTLESEYILNNVELKDDLVGMIVELHSSESSHVNRRAGILSNELAVHSLLRLPVTILKRKERERILDLLLEACLVSGKQLTPTQLSSSMSLMVKLMQLPNATAELATNPSALWDLATKCQNHGGLGKVTLFAFEALVSLTLSHMLSTLNQDRASHYLAKNFEHFCSCLGGASSFLDSLLILGLVKEILIMFWSNRNALRFGQNTDLNHWRAKHLEVLASDLKVLHGEWTKTNALSFGIRSEAILEAIASIPGLDDLAGQNSESATVKSIMEVLRPLASIQAQHPGVSGGEMLSSLPAAGFKVISKLENYNKELLLRSIIPLLDRDLVLRDRAVARSIIKSWITSLQEDEQSDLFREITKEITKGAHESEPSLLCLRIAISTIENQSSRIKEVLVQVHQSLCEMVKKSDGIRQFRLTMDCLESLILTRPWALSQWEIDTTLACIVFMASSHAPGLPTRYAGFIYSRLCGLMNGLLTVHRLKLRGRFHIIIPVLQSLLRCLFTRNPSTHIRSSKSNTSPNWLSPKGLEAPQARAYARLLTSLCDPTVSSVTAPGKKRQRDDLTPATDKARKMAGQHLPYVLMEYIQCRLHSNLASAEVKQALMPGIYALLDSMSQETRRMVNAAMDSSGRAMFRDLWADYTRFRKWNES